MEHGHLETIGIFMDSMRILLGSYQPNGMTNYSCQLKALDTIFLPSQRSHSGTHRSLGYPEIGLELVPNAYGGVRASNGAYG